MAMVSCCDLGVAGIALKLHGGEEPSGNIQDIDLGATSGVMTTMSCGSMASKTTGLSQAKAQAQIKAATSAMVDNGVGSSSPSDSSPAAPPAPSLPPIAADTNDGVGVLGGDGCTTSPSAFPTSHPSSESTPDGLVSVDISNCVHSSRLSRCPDPDASVSASDSAPMEESLLGIGNVTALSEAPVSPADTQLIDTTATAPIEPALAVAPAAAKGTALEESHSGQAPTSESVKPAMANGGSTQSHHLEKSHSQPLAQPQTQEQVHAHLEPKPQPQPQQAEPETEIQQSQDQTQAPVQAQAQAQAQIQTQVQSQACQPQEVQAHSKSHSQPQGPTQRQSRKHAPPDSASHTSCTCSTYAELNSKYAGELNFMLKEFKKLEQQLLWKAEGSGAGAVQVVGGESAASKNRREKLQSFIRQLQDIMKQIGGEVGVGKDNVTNARQLEKHILANILPVKVRLLKQLSAQGHHHHRHHHHNRHRPYQHSVAGYTGGMGSAAITTGAATGVALSGGASSTSSVSPPENSKNGLMPYAFASASRLKGGSSLTKKLYRVKSGVASSSSASATVADSCATTDDARVNGATTGGSSHSQSDTQCHDETEDEGAESSSVGVSPSLVKAWVSVMKDSSSSSSTGVSTTTTMVSERTTASTLKSEEDVVGSMASVDGVFAVDTKSATDAQTTVAQTQTAQQVLQKVAIASPVVSSTASTTSAATPENYQSAISAPAPPPTPMPVTGTTTTETVSVPVPDAVQSISLGCGTVLSSTVAAASSTKATSQVAAAPSAGPASQTHPPSLPNPMQSQQRQQQQQQLHLNVPHSRQSQLPLQSQIQGQTQRTPLATASVAVATAPTSLTKQSAVTEATVPIPVLANATLTAAAPSTTHVLPVAKKSGMKKKRKKKKRRRSKHFQSHVLMGTVGGGGSSFSHHHHHHRHHRIRGMSMPAFSTFCCHKNTHRNVEYVCASCNECYHVKATSACTGMAAQTPKQQAENGGNGSDCATTSNGMTLVNPWWALRKESCPKCGQVQIPRIDISAPANYMEYHPALLAHIQDTDSSNSASAAAAVPPPIPPTAVPAGSSDDEYTDGSGEYTDDDDDNDSRGGGGGVRDDDSSSSSTASHEEDYGRDYAGPKLNDLNAARVLILIDHASTCPGRHKNSQHSQVCRSTKYMMLHVRDCPGTLTVPEPEVKNTQQLPQTSDTNAPATSNEDVTVANCNPQAVGTTTTNNLSTSPAQAIAAMTTIPCPFSWCRPVKHLLYHLVSCTSGKACRICHPKTISDNMATLTSLNAHRRKKRKLMAEQAMKEANAAVGNGSSVGGSGEKVQPQSQPLQVRLQSQHPPRTPAQQRRQVQPLPQPHHAMQPSGTGPASSAGAGAGAGSSAGAAAASAAFTGAASEPGTAKGQAPTLQKHQPHNPAQARLTQVRTPAQAQGNGQMRTRRPESYNKQDQGHSRPRPRPQPQPKPQTVLSMSTGIATDTALEDNAKTRSTSVIASSSKTALSVTGKLPNSTNVSDSDVAANAADTGTKATTKTTNHRHPHENGANVVGAKTMSKDTDAGVSSGTVRPKMEEQNSSPPSSPSTTATTKTVEPMSKVS